MMIHIFPTLTQTKNGGSSFRNIFSIQQRSAVPPETTKNDSMGCTVIHFDWQPTLLIYSGNGTSEII